MDSKDYDLVKEEITLVISELNAKEILSNHDKIEIEDHFYCDVEELVASGLSTKEALLVARSRFGELEGIREDYEVVKPESNLFYYGVIGILVFSLIKGLFVFIDILSQAFWYSYTLLGLTDISGKLWMDIPIRVLLIVSGLLFILNYIRRNRPISVGRFWYVPLVYLSLEILKRVLGIFLMPLLTSMEDSMALFGQMQISNILCGVIAILMLSIVSSYSLFKLKRNENRYV